MELAVRATSPAAPETLYALVADGTTWPDWAPMDSFTLERPGESGGESVGAVRVFRTGRHVSREQIVELVPGRRLSYVLLSGLPLRDYRADIDLLPEPGGTVVSWRSRFRPKLPGTGWIYRAALRRFIQRCADGLAGYRAP